MISCIADCHLGYRHKQKKQRLLDYESAFKEAVEKIEALDPKLLIFGGDILHHSHFRPEPCSFALLFETVLRFSKRAQILFCIGNHEIGGHLSTSFIPIFHRLPGVHVLTTEHPWLKVEVDGNEVLVFGFQFLRSREIAEQKLLELARFASSEEADAKILCLHQAVEGYLTPHELSKRCLAKAARSFDLILLGHVHKHQRVEAGGTPCYYIGSTERTSFNEWNCPTGFLHFPELNFEEVEFIQTNAAKMRKLEMRVEERLTAEELNQLIRRKISENLDVNCLLLDVEAEVDDWFRVKHDWESEFDHFTVLEVRFSRTQTERDVGLEVEQLRIDEGVLEEYVKMRYSLRGDLEEVKRKCVELFRKYSD